MKTISTYFRIFFFVLIITNICSCSENDTSIIEGQIYFRWIQNLDSHGLNGLWCNITSGNFTDNNDDVPNNAIENNFYGPCLPGTYEGNYDFDYTQPQNYYTPPFNYTLEKPESGYARYYSINLRKYNSSLNRCISTANEPSSLTFYDEQL